jgi:hypothetical protein
MQLPGQTNLNLVPDTIERLHSKTQGTFWQAIVFKVDIAIPSRNYNSVLKVARQCIERDTLQVCIKVSARGCKGWKFAPAMTEGDIFDFFGSLFERTRRICGLPVIIRNTVQHYHGGRHKKCEFPLCLLYSLVLS